jgi:hypothetical protein
MTEQGYSESGDPMLELFGHGWTPAAEQTIDTYTGRHRAVDRRFDMEPQGNPQSTPKDATESTEEQRELQHELEHRDDDPYAPGRHQDHHQVADET